MIEEIVAKTSALEASYHEDLADDLFQAFGAEQVLTAHHHGVDIETRRGAKSA